MKKKRNYIGQVRMFLFALLIFCAATRNVTTPEAAASTTEEIRVGLKSRYANKQSISLCNTELEFGYCDGRTYKTEKKFTSKSGITVTPEKGEFFEAAGEYTLSQAEEIADRLQENGAVAYAVTLSSGKAGVYLPVLENGTIKEKAGRVCQNAGAASGVTIAEEARKSAYLIRIETEEEVFFADGENGIYPQFAATAKDEDGIYALDFGSRSYRGRIEIGRYGGKTTLTAVNVVPLEEYLYGVVPCEMPASWNIEALKAQAVCARSYALIKAGYHSATELKRGFRMEDTVQSQVYGGILFEHARSNAAVDATKGETICYENRTVAGYYFSVSGGHTENVEDVWGVTIPYLQGVPDIYETEPAKKPWVVALKKSELEKLLRTDGTDVGTIKKVVQELTTGSGRVTSLRIIGTRGTVSLETSELRTILELPSTKFKVVNADITPDIVTVKGASEEKQKEISGCYLISVDGGVSKADSQNGQYVVLSADNLTGFGNEVPEGDEVLFVGMGHGHGVGMSQSGANGMAKKGFSYTEILEHYFTGISVR